MLSPLDYCNKTALHYFLDTNYFLQTGVIFLKYKYNCVALLLTSFPIDFRKKYNVLKAYPPSLLTFLALVSPQISPLNINVLSLLRYHAYLTMPMFLLLANVTLPRIPFYGFPAGCSLLLEKRNSYSPHHDGHLY